MTNYEAADYLRFVLDLFISWSADKSTTDETKESVSKTEEAFKMAIAALDMQTEVMMFDKEEIHHNCTVQVLTNSVTGDTSIGWWEEEF